MDFRKTFDRIPESFDKYRPRYCEELFRELITACDLNADKKVLEIGPGTGQATEPVLKTGCDYTAIELGENFTFFMQEKFGAYPNFKIVNADFENVLNYGYVNWKYTEWKKERVLSAEEYISYISTHCEHITLEEPHKSDFYEGIRKAIMNAGNRIVITDTIPLYLVQKG